MNNDVHTHPKQENGKPFGAALEKRRLDLRGKSVAEIVSMLTSAPVGREDGTALFREFLRWQEGQRASPPR